MAFISLSQLLVCTLSLFNIRVLLFLHPIFFIALCQRFVGSRAGRCSLICQVVTTFFFCVIRRLCLTQINAIHPLFKLYNGKSGIPRLLCRYSYPVPGNKRKNKSSHRAWPDNSHSDLLIAEDLDQDRCFHAI